MEGFWRYEFGGLIFEGAYFWNFTVAPQSYEILHICMVGGVQPCPPPPPAYKHPPTTSNSTTLWGSTFLRFQQISFKFDRFYGFLSSRID